MRMTSAGGGVVGGVVGAVVLVVGLFVAAWVDDARMRRIFGSVDVVVGFVGSLFEFSLEDVEGVDGRVGHVGCDRFEMWWLMKGWIWLIALRSYGSWRKGRTNRQ